MSKFTIINTFKRVTFNEDIKPLVICDIDFTLLHCSISMERIYQLVKNDSIFLEIKENDLEKAAIDWRNIAYNMGFIKLTDPEGFVEMVNSIRRLGGKLIFLTARDRLSHDLTIKQFIQVGIQNPEQYEIHYTDNKISKGEYIKKYNLLNNYQHISFIDDYISYLGSVLELFPQVNCYLFNSDS